MGTGARSAGCGIERFPAPKSHWRKEAWFRGASPLPRQCLEPPSWRGGWWALNGPSYSLAGRKQAGYKRRGFKRGRPQSHLLILIGTFSAPVVEGRSLIGVRSGGFTGGGARGTRGRGGSSFGNWRSWGWGNRAATPKFPLQLPYSEQTSGRRVPLPGDSLAAAREQTPPREGGCEPSPSGPRDLAGETAAPLGLQSARWWG